MKRGIHNQMMTVRELFGRMRTHSVACTVAAVTLATLICGAVVVRAIANIRAGGTVRTRDREILETMEADDAVMMEQNDAIRVRLDTMYVSLQTLKANVDSGAGVVETIERSLHEMSGADGSTRQQFLTTAEKLAVLDDIMEDAFGQIGAIQEMLDKGASDAPDREDLGIRMGELGITMSQIVEQYASISADVSDISTRLRNFGGGAKEFHRAVDVLQDSFTGDVTELAGLDTQLAEMESLLSQARTPVLDRLTDSADSMNRLSDQVETSNRDVNTLREQVEDSNRIADALNEQIMASNQKADNLNEQIMTSNQMAGVLNEQIMASNRMAGALSEQIMESNRLTNDVNAQVTSSNELLRMLMDEMRSSGQTISDLGVQVSEARAEIRELRGLLAAANQGAENSVPVQTAPEIAPQKTETPQTRGSGYIMVSFNFNLTREKATYTFDLGSYLSNHEALTINDILVKSYTIHTSGSDPNQIGIGGGINMNSAVYDPSTGGLTVTERLLDAPFGSQEGTVTFAVLGGIPR